MPGACGRRRCRSAEVFGVQQGFCLNSCSHIASLRQALQPFLRQLPLFTAENQQQRPRRPHLQWKGLVKKWGPTAMQFTKVTLHCIRKPLGRPDDIFFVSFFGFIRLFVDRDGKVWEIYWHSLSCPSGARNAHWWPSPLCHSQTHQNISDFFTFYTRNTKLWARAELINTITIMNWTVKTWSTVSFPPDQFRRVVTDFGASAKDCVKDRPRLG